MLPNLLYSYTFPILKNFWKLQSNQGKHQQFNTVHGIYINHPRGRSLAQTSNSNQVRAGTEFWQIEGDCITHAGSPEGDWSLVRSGQVACSSVCLSTPRCSVGHLISRQLTLELGSAPNAITQLVNANWADFLLSGHAVKILEFPTTSCIDIFERWFMISEYWELSWHFSNYKFVLFEKLKACLLIRIEDVHVSN